MLIRVSSWITSCPAEKDLRADSGEPGLDLLAEVGVVCWGNVPKGRIGSDSSELGLHFGLALISGSHSSQTRVSPVLG